MPVACYLKQLKEPQQAFHLSTPLLSGPQQQTAVHTQQGTHQYGQTTMWKKFGITSAKAQKCVVHLSKPISFVAVVSTGGAHVIWRSSTYSTRYISDSTPHATNAGLVLVSKTDKQALQAHPITKISPLKIPGEAHHKWSSLNGLFTQVTINVNSK